MLFTKLIMDCPFNADKISHFCELISENISNVAVTWLSRESKLCDISEAKEAVIRVNGKKLFVYKTKNNRAFITLESVKGSEKIVMRALNDADFTIVKPEISTPMSLFVIFIALIGLVIFSYGELIISVLFGIFLAVLLLGFVLYSFSFNPIMRSSYMLRYISGIILTIGIINLAMSSLLTLSMAKYINRKATCRFIAESDRDL